MATGWWGGLTDQLSSMAKDVLTEGTEEVDDHATALQLEQKKTTELQTQNTAIKLENENLRQQVTELNDSLHSTELQVSAVNTQYKSILQDREEEVKGLKRTIEELNESNRSLLSSSTLASAPSERSHYHHFNQPSSHPNGVLFEESEDLLDSVYHQQEINRLNSELERSRAECLALKRASTPQQLQGSTATSAATDEQSADTIQGLKERLDDESERHRKELENLEHFHRQEIADLHKTFSQQYEEKAEQLAKEFNTTISTLTREHEESTATTSQKHADQVQELERKISQLETEGRELANSLEETKSELTTSKLQIAGYHERDCDEGSSKVQLVKHESQDRLADSVAELQTLLESSHAELAGVEQQLRQSQEQCDEYKLQVEEYKMQVEELRGDNSALDQSLVDLNQEHEVILEQLIQQRDELKSQNRSLLDERESQPSDSSEVVELKAKLEKASFSLNEIHMDKAEVEKELDTCKAKLKVVADKYKELLTKHKKSVKELEEANDELTAMKMSAASIDISDHVTSSVEDVERLSTANRDLQTQLTLVQDELMAAKRSLASAAQLETRVGELGEQLDESEDKVVQLENRLRESTASDDVISQLEARNKELSLSHEQALNSQQVLESRVKEVETEIDRHVGLESEWRQKLNQSEEACHNLHQSEATLREKLEASEKRNEELTFSDANLREQLHKAFTQIEDLRLTEANLSTDLNQSRSEVTNLSQSETELKKRLSQMEEDFKNQLKQAEDSLNQSQTDLQALRQSEIELKAALTQSELKASDFSQSHLTDVDILEQLNGDKETLQLQVDELTKDLNELNTKHQKSVKELEEANDELTAMKMSAASIDISDHVTSSVEDVERLSTANRDLQTQLGNCKLELEELKQTSSEKELDIHKLKESLEKSMAEIGQLQDRFDQSQTGTEQHNALIAQLESRNSELENSFTDLHSQKRELTDLLSKSESEVRTLNQLGVDLKARNSLLEAEIRKISQSETELKDLLIQSEAEIQDLKKSESATADRLKQLETNSSESEASRESELRRLVSEKEHLEEELKDCRDELTAAKRLEVRLSTQQQLLEVAEGRCTDVTELLQSSQAKNEDLLSQLEAKSRELKSSIGQLNHLESEVDKLKADREQLSIQLTQLTAGDGNTETTSRVEELEAEVLRLQSLLSQSENEALQTDTSLHQLKEKLEEREELEQDRSLSSDATAEDELASDPTEGVVGDGLDPDTNPNSYSSDSEVSELRNQLAELQEILASKVLLINELQDSARSLQEEKAVLVQQIGAFQADRELLVSTLQQKHQEATSFHGEAVRLSAQLKEKESLLAANTAAASGDSQRDEELDALKSRLGKLKESLLEKDRMHEDIQLRLSSQSEALSLAQTECQTLRKQIENLTFELSATRAENEDRGDAIEKYRVQQAQQDSLVKTLRSAELDLQRTIKDKDREIAQLSSQMSSSGVTSDAVKEELTNTISTLTSERDTAHHTAQQNYLACQDLQASLSEAADKAAKLEREVDRLRSHLVSIEEGYTADLLQSEEREKDLRNRLALAEEKAASTTTAVQHASMEASKEICSLEEQLHTVSTQRDSLTMQLGNAQEQCSQYAMQLQNLQLVLEQFQREKDSMHAAEVEKLKSQLDVSQSTVSELQAELGRVQSQLDNQVEALEAAQRLTLQLERKEEAMDALRGEVNMRENQLRDAEDRIKRLSSNNESKVEKLLVKNLIINHISAPTNKKLEVLRLIASVLGFTQSDKEKVGLGDQPGWIGGLWQRLAHPSPSTKLNPDESFSELFVKFLETESTPKPAPLPLPVDKMVEEERKRAELHHRQAFNPFMASTEPKTASISKQQQSFPLIVGGSRDSSPLFTGSQPVSIAGNKQPSLSSTPVPLATATSALLPAATGSSTLLPAATGSSTLLPAATGSSTLLPAATGSSTLLPAATGSSTLLPAATGSSTLLPAATGSSTLLPAATGSSTLLPAATGSSTLLPAATGSSTLLPIATGSSTLLPAVTSTNSAFIPIVASTINS